MAHTSSSGDLSFFVLREAISCPITKGREQFPNPSTQNVDRRGSFVLQFPTQTCQRQREEARGGGLKCILSLRLNKQRDFLSGDFRY
jgi:hypothetical protein